MNPRILITDIREFKQITIQTGLPQGLLKKGFMGPRRAGGHDNTVEPFLFNGLTDSALGIFAAGEQVFRGMDDLGKTFCVFPYPGDIHDPADIGAAVADKDTDPGLSVKTDRFFGVGLTTGQAVPGIGQQGRGHGRCR